MTTEPFRMARLSRHGLIYGIGIIAGRAVAVVMLPLYTRVLTPADYGVIQLISMFLEVAAIFAGSRVAAGVFYYYHEAETQQERDRVLSTALSLLTLSYIVVSFAAYFLAPIIADTIFGARGEYVLYVRLACATLAAEGLVLVPMAHLQLRDRSVYFVTVGVVKLILQVALNIILLIPFRMGVVGVLVSGLVANLAIGTWLALHLARDVGVRVSPSAAGSLLRFGIPLVASQVSIFMLNFGDRYFLVKASDAAVVGLYGLAYQFGFLLNTLAWSPFIRIWQPTRFEIAKRPDRDELYARVFVYLNVVLFTLAMILALFTKDLLHFMAAPAFHAAAVLVPLILVGAVFQNWSSFFDLGIMVKERTEYYTLANWVAALVALGGYIWLIPRMLAWGAALTTAIAYGVRHVLVYWFSQRLWPVRYRWGPVARLIAIAVPIALLGTVAPDWNVGVSLLVRGGLFALYLFGLWTLGVLTEADRAFVRKAFRTPRAAMSTLIG